MHIADFYTCNAGGTPMSTFTSSNDPYWKVKVFDAGGSPVSGVSVVTKLYKPDGTLFMSYTQTTDASGIATFHQNLVNSSPKGTWTITVVSLTKSGWTYDPGANVKSQTTFIYQ